MVLNPRRLEFRSFEDMAGHLNTWAAVGLTTSEQWSDVLLAARQWLDYSGRNQLLLASYGEVDGPVAGAETWRLVPSSTEGRTCAVRAGEHGWPVRVPVTTGGHEPDPYLGGNRPTRAAVERWEWRPVFSVGQLARKPAPGALLPVEVPASLTGRDADSVWLDVARQVARTTVRGRLSKASDPDRVLAKAAERVARRHDQPPLDPTLCEQVAWLVADRVVRASGQLPSFDPEPLEPRDRWPRLQATLEASRKLTAAVGVVVGVDLTASPLPKMEIVDDRVVPAGSRRRLPAASLEQLPVGEWVQVGPYSPDEWVARGEQGAGRGAYLRLNRSAYLVALEQGTEAHWRLLDVAERTGHGLLANGTAATLTDAQADAVAAVGDRYPTLNNKHTPPSRSLSPASTGGRPPVVDESTPWQPVAGEGNSSARQRRINHNITVYVFPGPGGRWMPAVQNGATLTRLANVRTQQEARDAAELAGRRAARLAAVASPASLDEVVAELATSGDYDRATLAELVEPFVDQPRLTADEVGPDKLVELLGASGCTPATTVLVLRAERVEAAGAARLLPVIGVPMEDAIRSLQTHWQLSAVQAAEAVGATASEMRAAGCPVEEILAARPREVLRALPADAHIWDLAAVTMQHAGHPTGRVVSHLVAHAPTTDAFAAGLAAVEPDDPATGIALAVRYGAQADHLAAASELYGLSPTQTAVLLADAGTTPHVAVDTINLRCDGDRELTADVAAPALGLSSAEVLDQLDDHASGIATSTSRNTLVYLDDVGRTDSAEGLSPDPTDPATLLASLPDAQPGNDLSDESLLAALPDPHGHTSQTLDVTRGDP